MSRILCPKCGTKISDKATKCPHCGFQSADPKRPISEQDKYEMIPAFEYDVEEWHPNRGELSIISYEDNRSLIQYFGKWENIKVKLPAIAEVIGAMAGKVDSGCKAERSGNAGCYTWCDRRKASIDAELCSEYVS